MRLGDVRRSGCFLLALLTLALTWLGMSSTLLPVVGTRSASPRAANAPRGFEEAVEGATDELRQPGHPQWVADAAKRLSEPNNLMGSAGAALVSTIASELRLKKAELEGTAFTLLKSTAAVAMELNETRTQLIETRVELEQLRQHVFALETPWVGRAGEQLCALGHRCNNYIEAGERNLSSVVSVSACQEYCSRSFSAPVFAFHNEFGMVHFLLHPKGRCRCYDSVPCDVVSDGGYNLWSTLKSQPAHRACPPEVPRRLRGEAEVAGVTANLDAQKVQQRDVQAEGSSQTTIPLVSQTEEPDDRSAGNMGTDSFGSDATAAMGSVTPTSSSQNQPNDSLD
mmetsp:Transcript_39722/g.104917  ORF Transcript_39722/g.104917 Transcript_39722/m.104917 type:complete len:340 (-) Transcript_39722:113-1132(-)